MAVYVGPMLACIPNTFWTWGRAAHLEADTEADLDAFAKSIGLKPSWKQRPRNSARFPWPHYDLTVSKRAAAVRAGAIEQTARERVERWRAWRKQAPSGAEGGSE